MGEIAVLTWSSRPQTLSGVENVDSASCSRSARRNLCSTKPFDRIPWVVCSYVRLSAIADIQVGSQISHTVVLIAPAIPILTQKGLIAGREILVPVSRVS